MAVPSSICREVNASDICSPNSTAAIMQVLLRPTGQAASKLVAIAIHRTRAALQPTIKQRYESCQQGTWQGQIRLVSELNSQVQTTVLLVGLNTTWCVMDVSI